MVSKQDVNDVLLHVVEEDFIKLWWGLKIPGLGYAKPNEVWESDPEKVLEYVKGYLDTSFS